MIDRIIVGSLKNRVLVLLAAAVVRRHRSNSWPACAA